MIQYALLRRSSRFLRWYRTRVLLDFDRLLASLPAEGKLLDVGCGVGSLDYEIALRRPGLSVLGIDIDPNSVALARQYHSLPNVRYAHQLLQDTEGSFDCILFVDVLHHIEPREYGELLRACQRLLTSSGYILIKDIERRRGHISLFLDRFVSGCSTVYLHDCREMAEIVDRDMRVQESQTRFRFPFPHYYIQAA